MKVLLATPLFPPESGGPATDAALLHTVLPNYGIDTIVYTFSTVRHLPSGVRHACYILGLLRRARGISAIIALDTFSVCLPAALAARILRVPLIVRVPGDFVWEQATQRFGVTDDIETFQIKRYGRKVELLRWIQYVAVRSATLTVVPSDFFLRIVSHWGIDSKRLLRIYLGMNHSEFPKIPAKVPDGKILFSVGRFVPWKGFTMLIEFLPELPKEWHLVLAGDGPQRAALERLAYECDVVERVTFTGRLAHEEVLGWYVQSDAFALNTSFESFSFQLLEAMNAGVPIITTAVGSIPELLGPDEGILCSPNDKEAFKNAILSTEYEPVLWKERTQAAKCKAQRFSEEVSVGAFADALKKICA